MKLKTYQRLLLALLSVVLLSLGWLRTTGLVLLVALVPLLIISASYDSSRRSWWRMAGWVSLVMGLWTIVTCWWIYFAAAVGIVAATVVQILLFGSFFLRFLSLFRFFSRCCLCFLLGSVSRACCDQMLICRACS